MGTFQSQRGGDQCFLCKKGGYCDNAQKCDGGFLPCPPGTFGDKIGQSDESASTSCPPGTIGIEIGASSITSCSSCKPPPSEARQRQCSICGTGTYQSELCRSSCEECPAGTFSLETKATSSATYRSGPVNQEHTTIRDDSHLVRSVALGITKMNTEVHLARNVM